ncbi:lantibiotic dehydratase [Streptomyces sp. NRRL F-5053]|uniref:lantibiotic dehydratase n=1 Tax=Streptomyces sp. NRRL F-5053 TaxID=1463854 RepID=UPI0004CC8EDA|nr:lantibiotic dehydratase [Streptomyces sp. NRRL F-5053]
MTGRSPHYRAQREFLVRAVHHPKPPIPAWPDLTDATPDGIRSWWTWLRETWRLPQLADAVRHASPSVGRELDALAGSEASGDAAKARRLVLALAGYSLRLHRATPFGLFAAVAEGAFRTQAHVRWGDRHRAVARADGQWLADVVAELESMAAVRHRLHLVANNTVQVRGERLVLPWRPRSRDMADTTVYEVSLRRTAAVRAAMTTAAAPIAYADLAHKLTAELPGEDARALLDVLISRRFLLTSLQPPATDPDALGYVVAQLQRSGADGEAEAADLVACLRDIHAQMTAHNQAPAATVRGWRADLSARMRSVGTTPTPLAVDVHLDAEVRLPHAVAWEAESALQALARVTPQPHGAPAWTRYRDRFRRRYGDDALVPLLEVISPDTGLGLPEDFLGTGHAPAPDTSRRDAVLLAHAQHALADGRDLELDEDLIEQLAPDPPHGDQLPPHAELLAQVHAASTSDLQAGHFTLVTRRVGHAWGSLSGGRFAALLADQSGPSALVGRLARRPTSVDGALPAQLAFPPFAHGASHITRTPRLVAPMISLAEHRTPDPDIIPLSDLWLLCHHDRLHLVSLDRGTVIEAAIPHPLQLECGTPGLARFLEELTRGQRARLTGPTGQLLPFDWGAARQLPIRPRVRHGRSILSPAVWRVASAGLPGKSASDAEWTDAVAALRERWGIPRLVYLDRVDNRLRLDLDQPAHLALLRSHLQRPYAFADPVLTEAEPEDAYGWCHQRPTELVLLLASTARPRPAPPLATAPTTGRYETRLPGASTYLCARLHCQPQARTALMTDHLPTLLTDLGQATCWLTPDTAEQVTVTVRLPHADAAAAAMRHLGTWAEQLVDTGLISDIALIPYRPHLGVWGDGDLVTAAESVLAADTQVITYQLRHRDLAIDADVLAAQNLLSIATGLHGDAHDAMRWLTAQPKPAGPPLPQDLVRQARDLADPANGWPRLRATPRGADLLDTHWLRRTTALATYRAALRRAARPIDEVLRALLHAHLALASTPTRSQPATAWRMARAVALAAIHPHH